MPASGLPMEGRQGWRGRTSGVRLQEMGGLMACSLAALAKRALPWGRSAADGAAPSGPDRKSTRLNSSHSQISYAVFCLKKKKSTNQRWSATDKTAVKGKQMMSTPGSAERQHSAPTEYSPHTVKVSVVHGDTTCQTAVHA